MTFPISLIMLETCFIGLRLISKISEVRKNNTCVILGCESVECMRLEAGGMADMQLIEQVVPNAFSSSESDVSRLLGSSRGSTSHFLKMLSRSQFKYLMVLKNKTN